MSSKTLDQEVKGLNDGLVSMDVVKEAPAGNLPVLKDQDKGLNGEPDSLEDSVYKELLYYCDLAGKDTSYLDKYIEFIVDELDNHNFVKKDSHYKRIRDDKVDYLFLQNFGNNHAGTVAITIDWSESEDFENLISEAKREIPEVNKMGIYGPIMGIAAIPATIVGISFIVANSLNPFPIGMPILFGSPLLGAAIAYPFGHYREYLKKKERENSRNEIQAKYETLMERYKDKMLVSDKKYDANIMKHYFDLTPKWLLEKKSGGGFAI